MLTKKDLIYIGLIAIIFYQVFCKNNIENMSNVNNQVVKNEIINQVKSELAGTYKDNIDDLKEVAKMAADLKEGKLDINGSLSINGNLNVTGDSSVRNSTVSGNSTISGNSTVSGNSTISGNSTVSGDSTVNKNLTVNKKTKFCKTRYVQVGNTKDDANYNSYWSISQVEVYDENGTNVALGKPARRINPSNNATITALYSTSYPPTSITDGKVRTNTIHQYYHGVSERQLLEVDLGQEYYVKNIVVTGRWSGGYAERQNGTHAELFNKDRQSQHLVFFGPMWNDLTRSITF